MKDKTRIMCTRKYNVLGVNISATTYDEALEVVTDAAEGKETDLYLASKLFMALL